MRRNREYKVRTEHDEGREIERLAAEHDHSVSSYFRLCALGRITPKPVKRAGPPRAKRPAPPRLAA